MPCSCVDLLALAVRMVDVSSVWIYPGVVWFGVASTALYTRLIFVMVRGCCWVCSFVSVRV